MQEGPTRPTARKKRPRTFLHRVATTVTSVTAALPLLLAALPPLATAARGSHYPTGVCDRNCTIDPLPCLGQTCGPLSPTACNRYLAPTTDPESDARPWTYCTFDFNTPCADDRLGCPRCALRQIAINLCTPAQRCVPNPDKGYAVMRAVEDNAETGPGEACFTTNHFMLVPYRPCTGVESPDPECTGRPAEKYWGHAWDEARARGFGVPDGPFAGLPWGVLLNPKNARSQHHAHFRFAPLKTNLSDSAPSNAVVPNFLAQPVISTDIKRPTFTWGERAALFVSVFVPIPEKQQPIDGRAIATRVRPFKRAAAVAKAAMPLTMYGILVTPAQQPVVLNKPRRGSKAGGTNATGVVVTAFSTRGARS